MGIASTSVVKTPTLVRLFGKLLLAVGTICSAAVAQAGAAPITPDFGPNVLIFDPSMPQTDIQTAVNNIAAQQVSNQFGPQRDAL